MRKDLQDFERAAKSIPRKIDGWKLIPFTTIAP